MDYALDSATNREYEADTVDKRWARRRRLVCPVCKKPVALRAGRVHRAHFAHVAGVGSPACELYHPSDGHVSVHQQIHPFSVYLRPEQPLQAGSAWTLELVLSHIGDSGGTLSVDGLRGRVSIPGSELYRAPRIAIRAETTPITIRGTGELDSGVQQRINIPVPGLSPRHLSIFRYTDRGGRRLSDRAPLYWGRGYFAVWPKSLALEWPASVWREELRFQTPWRCARLELPGFEDELVEQWADVYANREVEHPRLQISVVSPPLLELDDEAVIVEEGLPVIIGVLREHGAPIASEMRVTSREWTEVVEFADDEAVLVSIRDFHEPVMLSIECGHDDESYIEELRITPRKRGKVKHPPAARIVFDVGNDRRVEPAFSARLSNLFADVQLGQVKLAGLDLPPGVGWQVRARNGRGPWRTQQRWLPERGTDFVSVGVSHEASVDWVKSVKDELGKWDELCLDFADYGAPIVPRPRLAGDDVGSLPRQLAHQIRWLASLPTGNRPLGVRAPTTGGMRALRARIQADTLTKELLDRVLARALWPALALPHLNQADAESRRLVQAAFVEGVR